MYKIPANTVFLGKNLVFMPECHSTNSFALELCQQSSSTADGTIIITTNQSAGRGQRGNVWQVEPGKNLTFSIILKPTFLAIPDQFYLNVFTSLSIYDYLVYKGCSKISIKWPNDIYVNEKKICGILIENQLLGNLFTNTIIGIGLNINQKRFEIATATSLSVALDQEFELQAELEVLLAIIEARYLQLRHHNYAALMSDYLRSMFWLNEEHTFSSNGESFDGVICGVDEHGRLRIKSKSEIKVFGVKEISYVQ